MPQKITIKEVLKAAGGGTALARELRINKAAVYQWRHVPVARVLDVERITGISRYRLRPDVYGQEEEGAA